jgi:hypothetical protein
MNQCGLQYTCVWKQCQESLYSCLYLKLAKTLSFFLSLSFLFNKIREQEGGTGSAQKGGGGRPPKQCIHMWVNVKMIKFKKGKKNWYSYKSSFNLHLKLNSNLGKVPYYLGHSSCKDYILKRKNFISFLTLCSFLFLWSISDQWIDSKFIFSSSTGIKAIFIKYRYNHIIYLLQCLCCLY